MKSVSTAIASLIFLASASASAEEVCCPTYDLDDPFRYVTIATTASEQLPEGDVRLSWPVKGQPVLNSPFGPRQLGSQSSRYDWHRGVDLKMPMGTELYAPADGIIVHAGAHPAYRDTILQIRHNSGEPAFYTVYLHLDKPLVEAGQFVKRGDLIALSGQGSATYPHLHWEVRRGCLRQECCESPLTYLDYTNTPPPPPVLSAFGETETLGRMVLVSWKTQKDEIDYQRIAVNWGASTAVADVNALNALTPRGQASKLDHPLFFYERSNKTFVIFPKRFNDSRPSADYDILVWNLDNSVTSGTAALMDAFGEETAVEFTTKPTRISVRPSSEKLIVDRGDSFTITNQIRNHDEVARTINFQGQSAQSTRLAVNPPSITLEPGATAEVTISGTHPRSLANDVGDMIILLSTIADSDYTPFVSGTMLIPSINATDETL